MGFSEAARTTTKTANYVFDIWMSGLEMIRESNKQQFVCGRRRPAAVQCIAVPTDHIRRSVGAFDGTNRATNRLSLMV